MPTRCLFCDEDYHANSSLTHLLLTNDPLCVNCRNALQGKIGSSYLGDLKIRTFYEYNALFKALLLQYKECYDEALAPVFLYPFKTYLALFYHGYTLIPVPSSKANRARRGFNHLEAMVKDVHLAFLDALTFKEELDQKGKSRQERKKMRHNIAVKAQIKLPEKILLFDDVLTSGNSLLAAYDALNNGKRKIRIAVLAQVKVKDKR